MKKGFTIIEIILSIALVVIVGVGSTISFIAYKKYDKEKSLNNMSDEILAALKVYIETNSEAKSRIYEDYEGMAITLNTLESEGLIDFQDLDIEDEYVVAMLSNESDCSDVTTVESWDLTNGPLYICSKSNGNQNLFSVGGDAANLSKITRETYYFKGNNPQNYVKYGNKNYQIVSVEKDDSLILYSSSSFGSTFSEKTQNISYSTTTAHTNVDFACQNSNILIGNVGIETSTDQQKIDIIDVKNAAICESHYKRYVSSPTSYYLSDIQSFSWLGSITRNSGNEQKGTFIATSGYKIHLKECMKITGGTGDIATPYILEDKC